MVKYIDGFDNTTKIDGDKTDSIHRECIEEKEKELLRNADSVQDIKKYLAQIHDIDLEG